MGYLIAFSTSNFRIARAYSALAALVIISLLLFQSVTWIQRSMFRWSLPKAAR